MFVHVDAVKEFYAKMTVIHLKKKDVVKSSVKGISIEFDHERLAAILDVPGRTGICEYIKEVWEESRYTKPLDITRRIANDETITAARRVKSSEMKPFQRFIHFLVMKNVIPRFGKRDTSSFMDMTYMDHLMARRENGTWWIGSGENRRRDDNVNAPEEEAEEEEERNKDDFDREVITDEATIEGESCSDDQFYDAQVEVEEPMMKLQRVQTSSPARRRNKALQSRPSCPICGLQAGICEYIKEVWEESRYTKPLDITRRIANDETITAARRVKSSEIKPFQRFIHFLVMKNVIPRFGKRDTSSFMDMTYMDHLMARRLVDTPRVMMRHMSYVISMKDHECPMEIGLPWFLRHLESL
ncbi:hypothetical protein Dimus_030246 [Dionaea muscipula]